MPARAVEFRREFDRRVTRHSLLDRILKTQLSAGTELTPDLGHDTLAYVRATTDVGYACARAADRAGSHPVAKRRAERGLKATGYALALARGILDADRLDVEEHIAVTQALTELRVADAVLEAFRGHDFEALRKFEALSAETLAEHMPRNALSERVYADALYSNDLISERKIERAHAMSGAVMEHFPGTIDAAMAAVTRAWAGIHLDGIDGIQRPDSGINDFRAALTHLRQATLDGWGADALDVTLKTNDEGLLSARRTHAQLDRRVTDMEAAQRRYREERLAQRRNGTPLDR